MARPIFFEAARMLVGMALVCIGVNCTPADAPPCDSPQKIKGLHDTLLVLNDTAPMPISAHLKEVSELQLKVHANSNQGPTSSSKRRQARSLLAEQKHIQKTTEPIHNEIIKEMRQKIQKSQKLIRKTTEPISKHAVTIEGLRQKAERQRFATPNAVTIKGQKTQKKTRQRGKSHIEDMRQHLQEFKRKRFVQTGGKHAVTIERLRQKVERKRFTTPDKPAVTIKGLGQPAVTIKGLGQKKIIGRSHIEDMRQHIQEFKRKRFVQTGGKHAVTIERLRQKVERKRFTTPDKPKGLRQKTQKRPPSEL